MKLLIGMPDKNSWGGPNACEPPFIDALREFGLDVSEEVYVYGDKKTKSNVWQRVKRVINVAVTFRKKLKSETYDLVHLNTSFDFKAILRDVVTVTFLPKRQTKLFLKMHGSDDELLRTKNKIKKYLLRFLLKRVDGIGALSSEEKKHFVNASVKEEKVFVVKNVVNAQNQQIETLRNTNTPTLLFVSRFIMTKGLMDVIRASAILKDKGFGFKLKCVGDGEIRHEAEREVERLNLSEFLEFTGYVSESDVNKFYSTSDVLLFPTYHIEGFPMVIFNAAAAGLPIITTRIRAAADYLNEPDNCLWVEAKNPQQLAEKIIMLFENVELKVKMKRNNIELSKQFSATNIAKEYIEIYHRIIKQHHA